MFEVIHQLLIRLNELYKLMESFFKFRIRVRIFGRKQYISMDLSQRALQTNEKLFFKFQINIRNFDRKPKKYYKV